MPAVSLPSTGERESSVPSADRRTRLLLEAPIASTLLRLAVPNILVLAAQASAEQAAAKSLDLVKAQYRLGAASYLQLLDATRQWQQARIGYIQARAARLSDTAALYAALGGGWQQRDAQAEAKH